MIHTFTQGLDTANTEDGRVEKHRGVYVYEHEVIQHTLMQGHGWNQGIRVLCMCRERVEVSPV